MGHFFIHKTIISDEVVFERGVGFVFLKSIDSYNKIVLYFYSLTVDFEVKFMGKLILFLRHK